MRYLNPRTDIIQLLINRYKFKSYLEIGVEFGDTFLNITCDEKVGVDPDQGSCATLFVNSDDFFKQNTKTFDLIFIDGLHLHEQVVRDIENSLEILNENGIIVVHDCIPPSFFSARKIGGYEKDGTIWCGSVWLGWIELRNRRPDLEMAVVDEDYGVGIIRRGKQITIDKFIQTDNYEEDFKKWFYNKKQLSNIIDASEFFKRYIYG